MSQAAVQPTWPSATPRGVSPLSMDWPARRALRCYLSLNALIEVMDRASRFCAEPRTIRDTRKWKDPSWIRDASIILWQAEARFGIGLMRTRRKRAFLVLFAVLEHHSLGLTGRRDPGPYAHPYLGGRYSREVALIMDRVGLLYRLFGRICSGVFEVSNGVSSLSDAAITEEMTDFIPLYRKLRLPLPTLPSSTSLDIDLFDDN